MDKPVSDPHLSARTPEGAGELTIANAQLVLGDQVIRGAVDIAEGRIVAIREGMSVPKGAVDANGDTIIPGLIELHTDNLERHMQPRPGVDLPHRGAILAHDGELASCGITTVFDALRVGSVTENKSKYKKYARQVASLILDLRSRDVLKVRHLIHLRAEVCSNTLVEELAEFGDDDRVGLVSMMDHTPGQRQFRDINKLREYMSGKYAMSEEDFRDHIANLANLREQLGELHEDATVKEAARLGATLASHDDTTAEQVHRSAAQGIALAEFPTTIEAAQACRDAGMKIIMGAPNLVRGGSHSGNVSAGELAEAGLLDIISSDYVPALLIASAFRLAELWDDLPRAVATVSRTPADAAQLPDRGRIEAGAVGDLVRVHIMDGQPVVRMVWRGGVQIA